MAQGDDPAEYWISSRPTDLSGLSEVVLAKEILKSDDYIDTLDKLIAPFTSTEKRRRIESTIGLGVAIGGFVVGGPIGFAAGLGVTATVEAAHLLDHVHRKESIALKGRIIQYKKRLRTELKARL